MADKLLTKDVILDVSVNIIPLGILVIFLTMFLAITPWGIGISLASVIQILLIVLPLIGLAVLTYEGAKRIEQ